MSCTFIKIFKFIFHKNYTLFKTFCPDVPSESSYACGTKEWVEVMSVRLAELKDFSGFREKKKGSETCFSLISHN